jgi:hypothetical protein
VPGRSGKKSGKNVESAPLPPPTGRRRDGVAASSTRCHCVYDTCIHPANAAAPVGAFSPRSPCTICPLCLLTSGTHFDEGYAAAYENTMALTRLPGFTKCRSDDCGALWGRRSRSRRRTRGGVLCSSAGAYVGARKSSMGGEGSACGPLSHRSNPTDPDSTQMGESSILSLFWKQLERRRCVYCANAKARALRAQCPR